VKFDGVIDGRGGEQGIEPAAAGGGVVLGENGLDNGLLRERFARPRQLFAFRLEEIYMESQDVCVLDSVRDCVRVELLLEELTGSSETRLVDPLPSRGWHFLQRWACR
jgi:hypothetical protein